MWLNRGTIVDDDVIGGLVMWSRTTAVYVAGIAIVVGLAGVQPAAALTMQQCSAKYNAAQSSGALKGMTWQQFRKANCGPGASPLATAPTGSGSAALSPGATFPQAISPKYTNESAGKARMHTCLDQYRANKETNGNGGLRWIAKGGGYYSECNKRLKG
jgi:hypothetical protein